ncbi:serine protease, partial [Bacillus thuringiensis serovar yunnanensis]
MGYYDENNNTTRFDKTEYSRKYSIKKGYFFAVLLGAVVGVASISFAEPYISSITGNKAAMSLSSPFNSKVETTAVPVVNNKNATNLSGMIKEAKKVVVGVINIQKNQNPFTSEQTGQEQVVGSGSGVIYKKTGNKALIVTNNHVVEGESKLAVKLNDGKTVDAKIVGTDPLLDLAVIEIDGSQINTIVTLGDSSKIEDGDTAIAIGNPLGFDGSVTQGIISSKERELPVSLSGNKQPDWQAQVIQTDAAINPGNSGGALFNQNGELIGINSSKIAQKAVEGIGFAIPINIAKKVIASLEKDGKVKRPALGVGVKSLEAFQYVLGQLKLPKDIKSGVILDDISANSPAQKAGLEQNDIVIALDDQKVENPIQFRKYLYDKKQVGDKIKITFYRNGNKMIKTTTLAE